MSRTVSSNAPQTQRHTTMWISHTLSPRSPRTLASQCHELYNLMRPRHTTMRISHTLSPRNVSFQCHDPYDLNATNSSISMSRTVSSNAPKTHDNVNATHSIFTNSIISSSRSVSSQRHELCHLMRPRHTTIWMPHTFFPHALSS